MKSWQDLTITDDFLFCKIMSQPDLCKEMIELLLDIKVKRIENIQIQKQLTADYDARGIRMDVYVEDSNRVYDIEMQTTDEHNIEKRCRYYQSVIDVDHLERNMDYNELNESFIIFICLFDPFNKGYLRYTVRQCFEEDYSLIYNDKTNKVFYNLNTDELLQQTSPLGIFLRYLKTSSAFDEYTSKIQQAVKSAKYNLNWRKEYMTVGMKITEEKIKSYKEGEAKARLENAVTAVKELGLEISLVSEKFKVPLADLKKALESK